MLTLNLPSLQQLRVFEAVARAESISAASKLIHLSQPGVTQAIGSLERRVAVTLFDRRRTGCYLTAAGTIFLSRVQRLLAQLQQALCEPIVGTPFADGKSRHSFAAKADGRAHPQPRCHRRQPLV